MSCSRSRASARRARWRCIARASSATSSSRARPRVPRTCSRRWARPRPASSRCSSRRTCRAAPRRCARRSTKLSTEEVQVKVVAQRRWAASPSRTCSWRRLRKALIIGFNVRADAGARDAVKETGVEVRYYSIIYEAIDDVKQMMSGMLQPEIKETIVGVAQVREVFRSSKFGVVAGCLVTEGLVQAQQPDPRAARQRGDLRGRARVAAALQGRRRRSARRHRVRHRREELPGRARRRPDRVLLARRSGAQHRQCR